jgi:hypothetical protein
MTPEKISEKEYVCRDCGRTARVEERHKKGKLVMWTRIWSDVANG